MSDHLSQQPFGQPFIELEYVDSTNNYALNMVHAGLAQAGTAIFTHEQVAGKGQRGKNWLAARDSSIILTLIANPFPLLISQQFYLSMAVSLAVKSLLNKYIGDEVSIKWPNDIYWQDRKAGGVLIENKLVSSTSGNDAPSSHKWNWSVIGMGININQEAFPKELGRAVSVKQITGKNFDPLLLSGQLCEEMNKQFILLRNRDFETLKANYQNALYKKNQQVKFKQGIRLFEAKVLRVNDNGELVIFHNGEQAYQLGELEWIYP